MSFVSRLSEKWFRRGLWLISFIFCWFLIGLGGNLIQDLPKVTSELSITDFIDQKLQNELNTKLASTKQELKIIQKELKAEQHEYSNALNNYNSMRQNFDNWIKTRNATQNAEYDFELIQRTQDLEQAKQLENIKRDRYEQSKQLTTEIEANVEQFEQQVIELTKQAQPKYSAYKRKLELKIFLYRLVLTLPLLILAGFLLVRKRKSSWWPFVWGFVWFALFTFFVELVPYLPDYGGYVRYAVGIFITVIIGRIAITKLNKYLSNQKKQESLPDEKRRKQLNYDKVLNSLNKNICPSCERPINIANNDLNFCPHCAINLFNICSKCNTRKNAFANFCFNCGAPNG